MNARNFSAVKLPATIHYSLIFTFIKLNTVKVGRNISISNFSNLIFNLRDEMITNLVLLTVTAGRV